MMRGASAFAVVVMLSACSSLGPLNWWSATAPPTAVPALPAGSVATSPRLMWVPEWGIYLREGQDVALHRGAYYRYEADRWYTSDSPQGPWAPIEPPRAATTEIRNQGRSLDAGRPAHQRPSSNRSQTPPAIDGAGELAKKPNLKNGRRGIVQIALGYRGVPYRWGGTTPAGFDCSGFVQCVYARAGVSLPRTAADQYAAGAPVAKHQLEPGDLVFFDRLRHNGIYIGHGRFVHANQAGGGVKVSGLEDHWFKDRWSGARRIRAWRQSPETEPPRGKAATRRE